MSDEELETIEDARSWRELRPEVQRFARLMEQKLQANDHKGGWHDCHPEELLLRAYEELGELHREVVGRSGMLGGPARTLRIAGEGADVANMVMMVLDVCDALRGPKGGDHG